MLDYTKSFSPNDYNKNDKIIYQYLRTHMLRLKFRLKKTDVTRNYLLEEIKHNHLKSEKHNKTCTYLAYFSFSNY